jgi:hypothetical protein
MYPELGSGLWIDPETPSMITKCVPQEACLKTQGNTTICSPGYDGLYCSQCLAGFYRSSSACQKCGKSAFGIILFLAVFLLILVLSFRFLQSEGSLPVDWKICLNWIQILSFLPELSLQWPSNLSSLFKISSFSNFNIELFSPECSVSISTSQRFHMKANLLWIFTGFLVLSISIQKLISKTRFSNWVHVKPFKLTLCKLFNAVVVVYASIFTYTVLNVFSPARCSRQVDGRLLMTSNLTVQCGSKEWKPLFIGMMFYSVLYLIVFPIIIAVLFWKFRHQIRSPEEQMLIGGLTRSYKKEFFWWEIINVAKKISLTLSLSLPASSRNHIFFAVLVLFMCFEIMLRPFKLDIQSQLNSLWSLLTLLIVGTGFSTSIEGNSDSLSIKVFGSLVIVIFCLILGFSLRSMVTLFLRILKREKQETAREFPAGADPTFGNTNPSEETEIKITRLGGIPAR